MDLPRRPSPRSLISLVPLVDVLLILLVFFMVTSTYLDLDMIPTTDRTEAEAEAPDLAGGGGLLLVRLAPDGRPWLRGRPLSEAELRAALQAHVATGPGAEVNVLAAPRAELQALVSLMDLAAELGLPRLRVLRQEAAP